MQSRDYKTVLRCDLQDFYDFDMEVIVYYHLYPAIPESTLEPYEPAEPQRASIQYIETKAGYDIMELFPSEVIERIEDQLSEGEYE